MGITSNGVLYINGNPLYVNEMPEITFNSDKNDVNSFSHCRSCSFTGTFTYLRMSRKRFIRNLIKRGYSKKNAKWIAWYCCRKRIPYSRADTLISFGLSVV